MESVGLIQKQKEKVREYFIERDLEERPNAFTDLQDDAIRSVNNKINRVWSASFLDKTDVEWLDQLSDNS